MLAKRAGRMQSRVDNSYWMSYSDMMASLLLMFVLLLFLSFNQYTTLQEAKQLEVAAKEEELISKEAELTQAQEALTTRERELATMRTVLSSQQLTLTQQEQELAMSKGELEQSLAQLILQQKQIEEQEALLALSEEEIQAAKEQLRANEMDLESREITLSAKDAELLLQQLRVTDLETLLNQQAVQIDELVGVRARIIEQLRDAFFHGGLNVAVDHVTGSIVMDSTVFFDTDKAVLKKEGRDLLTRLLPVYFRTLMSDENAEFVGEIIVEGHTDSDGTYEHNLDLSQRRALAVVTFCMSDDFLALTAEEKETLRTMITANGRSKSQPIYDIYGIEDKAASRRVEIKFRLKDSEMIESISRILSEMGADGN